MCKCIQQAKVAICSPHTSKTPTPSATRPQTHLAAAKAQVQQEEAIPDAGSSTVDPLADFPVRDLRKTRQLRPMISKAHDPNPNKKTMSITRQEEQLRLSHLMSEARKHAEPDPSNNMPNPTQPPKCSKINTESAAESLSSMPRRDFLRSINQQFIDVRPGEEAEFAAALTLTQMQVGGATSHVTETAVGLDVHNSPSSEIDFVDNLIEQPQDDEEELKDSDGKFGHAYSEDDGVAFTAWR